VAFLLIQVVWQLLAPYVHIVVEPIAQTWHIILLMKKIKAPRYIFTTAVHEVNTYSSIVCIFYNMHVLFFFF